MDPFQVGWTRRTVTKGEVLLRAGENGAIAFSVIEGCLRSYLIDAKGKEHVMQFAPEGWVVSDLKAFARDMPATLNIDALEPSVVLVLTGPDFRNAIDTDQAFRTALLTKYQNSIIALNERLTDLLASSGEERYLRFVRTYPTLTQRLPQKLIASYLGVTPESLSRIRHAIAKRKPGMGEGTH